MPPKPATKTGAAKAPAKAKPKAATKTATSSPATKSTPAKGGAASKTDTKKVEEDMAKMSIKKVLVPEEIGLKEVANLVLYLKGDVGDKCRESKRWLFIIDRNGNVHTFLKYRDVNMISVTSQLEFQTEPLRRALQGSLKYGKPHVIDISDIDQEKALDLIRRQYNEIYDGCWEDLLNMKITDEDNISKLFRPNDDRDLQNPLDYRIADFSFVVYSKTDPASYANDSFFPVIVN
ncbi:hypothetical protein ACF0H5_019926 [Mactra antiquata]